MYFPGHNSWLFQLASRIDPCIRLGLLVHEARRRIGTPITAVVGRPLAAGALARYGERRSLTEYLRNETYELGSLAT